MQNASSTEIPYAKLGPGDYVDPGKIPDVGLGVFDGCGAYVREVFPFDGLEPSAILLFGSLPFGCTDSHVCVPMWLEDFGEGD